MHDADNVRPHIGHCFIPVRSLIQLVPFAVVEIFTKILLRASSQVQKQSVGRVLTRGKKRGHRH